MLISCRYCGRWHDRTVVCDKKPKKKTYAKKVTGIDNFRSNIIWQKKRTEIKIRDKYLCQICIRLLYDTVLQYNYDQLEVHHINSIYKAWGLRLNNNNLLTVCSRHHKMCDDGTIPIHIQEDIAKDQEDNNKINL